MSEVIMILEKASPMGAIVLSLVVILLQIRQRNGVTELKENHLHELKDTLERIEKKLDKLNDIGIGIAVLNTKLSKKGK